MGRGVHRLSQFASQKYNDAHIKVAGFIGAQEEEVIFTKNTTEAINMVAYGLTWEKGDEVVTTALEHHSNFLPWLRLKERGVILKIVKPNRDGIFDILNFENAIGAKTRLVAVTHVSNVLGTISPIKEISAICKEKGALLLVDDAQSTPHFRIDVGELGCDFFAFSGHKMLGPTGTGVLWVKDSGGIEPTFFGGGMIEEISLDSYKLTGGYERFEAGTPNIAGGIGLGRAVDFLKEVGMGKIRDYEERLAKRLLEGLQDIENVALMLDEASDIMVRSGHHCCMPLMNYLGLKEGTVRVSLYLYNTEEEVNKFLETVEEITKVA